MNIIGINGLKRSGKGETFKAVQTQRVAEAERVREVGFAHKLKIIAARSLGFTDRTDQECIDLMDSFKLDEPLGADFTVRYTEPGQTGCFPALHELTGREFLQNLGSWGRKVFGDTFWIDQVLPDPHRAEARALGDTVDPRDILAHQLEAKYPGVDTLCITDLRYPNEAERVRALGGKVWEVVRPGQVSDGHDSEQTLDRALVDRTILNAGDLTDLYNMVSLAYDEDFSC